ncbi:hypothetical protein Emed_000488 [Eimeria media]
MGLLSSGWFSEVPWLQVYVGFSLTVEALEQYLNYRQLQRYKSSKKPPAALSACITETEYEKLCSYRSESMRLTIVSSAVSASASLLSTVYFFGPFCWRLAGRMGYQGEYSQPLVFMALQKIVSECISTPFQVYGDFVVEERHGFNKKTPWIFVKDKIIEFCVSAAIGAPVLSAVTWLIKWGGPNFHYWPYILFVLRSLSHCSSTHQHVLAAQLKFPLQEVYEMDGSTRSKHSNAYFYGLWRWKRIVLFDTLLHLPHQQILAILGHELGHWKKRHMPQRLSLAFLNLFAVFYLYGRVMHDDNLYLSFGFNQNEKVPVVGLMLFANILAPVNAVLGLLSTLLSRAHEFQADAFACELGFGQTLKDALVGIYKENKANVDPDPWYSWWHFSHPPLLERLSAIDAILKKTDNSSSSSSSSSSSNDQQQQQQQREGKQGSACKANKQQQQQLRQQHQQKQRTETAATTIQHEQQQHQQQQQQQQRVCVGLRGLPPSEPFFVEPL